jgi:hypothetical protein
MSLIGFPAAGARVRRTGGTAVATTEVFVVETTEGDALIGHLLFGEGTLTVLSGFAGRPVILDQDEVDSIVPATLHPDVEGEQDDVPSQRDGGSPEGLSGDLSGDVPGDVPGDGAPGA